MPGKTTKKTAAKKKTAKPSAKKAPPAKMDLRAFRFAEEYLFDCNATRAYKAAYPDAKSPGAAAVGGHNLLRNPKVAEYVAQRIEEMKEEHIATANEVLMNLTAAMRGELTEQVSMPTGDGAHELVERPCGVKDRLRAAELLGKRLGLFHDKVDITTGGEQVKAMLYLPERKAPRRAAPDE